MVGASFTRSRAATCDVHYGQRSMSSTSGQLQHSRESQCAPAATLQYSPFLNIAENCFANWKASFKREMAEVRPALLQMPQQQREATMVQLATQNLAAITPAKCIAEFHKTTQYIGRMLQMQPILQDHAWIYNCLIHMLLSVKCLFWFDVSLLK